MSLALLNEPMSSRVPIPPIDWEAIILGFIVGTCLFLLWVWF